MDAISIPSPSAFLSVTGVQTDGPSPTSHRAPRGSSGGQRKTSDETSKAESAAKPKQSKSRNGCITCKAKRLKCDETKPTCQQCHKRSVECGGYKKDFKWRPFEEASFAPKAATGKARRGPDSVQTPGSTVTFAREVDTPLAGQPSPTVFSPVYAPLDPPQAAGVASMSSIFTYQPQASPAGAVPPQTPTFHFPSDPSTVEGPPHAQHDYYGPSSVAVGTGPVYGGGTPLKASGQSPKLVDLLLPGTDMSARPPELGDYRSRHPDAMYQPAGPAGPAGPYVPPAELAEDDVEDIVRQTDPAPEPWIMRLPSPTPSSSSSSSDGSRMCVFNGIPRQPAVLPGSPEQLMLRFDKQTCGILSIKDGPTENPWRTLVWPLARESPALYHAIASMTAFHTSKERPLLRMDGMDHMRRSIGALAADIGTMRTDTALATTLVLAFSESWDQHISTGIQHLRGARLLVDQALVKHRTSAPVAGDNLARLEFLVNTWVYMDVIARLTSIDDDESSEFENVISSAHDLFGPSTSLDPLMGCASTLFPLIGRVATLIRKVRRCRGNSPAIISQARALKARIEEWEAPVAFEAPEDPTSAIVDSLQTAEAYRWATLLYLHQAVPEIPSLTSAQLAKKVLNFVATVPLYSRAIIVQIYPLLAAGCEAEDDETRQWVRERWAAMANRMWIGNIDRCWEVIKEVWDRRDAHRARLDGARLQLEDPTWAAPEASGSSKRKFDVDAESLGWSFTGDGYGGGKRRATARDGEIVRSSPPRRESADNLPDGMDPGMTVRGHLHWVGVMKDWDWEGEYFVPALWTLLTRTVLLG
ncbi:MAG: hypothetical protein M1832_002448 [Thelocarpon impressellum]|nr:MAG: hypothetical protein M1832_002448 [Thelocarpon impressellum]